MSANIPILFTTTTTATKYSLHTRLLELPGAMQLSPSASSASQSKVQPRYSGGIGVSGNQSLLYSSIDEQSYPYSIVGDGNTATHTTLHWIG